LNAYNFVCYKCSIFIALKDCNLYSEKCDYAINWLDDIKNVNILIPGSSEKFEKSSKTSNRLHVSLKIELINNDIDKSLEHGVTHIFLESVHCFTAIRIP
jgi:hypothetical protein